MTNEELEQHLMSLGWNVEHLHGQDGKTYIVIRNYAIPVGPFAGRTVDVAIERTTTVPYIPPPALHIRPHLVPMGQFNTLNSGVGSEWQYWSRIVRQVTPRGVVTHIATVLGEVRL